MLVPVVALGQEMFPASPALDQAIEQSIRDKIIPGGVLVVVHDSKVLHRKAYGQRAIEPAQEFMTTDTNTIGGNVNQAVTARKMNLRRNLTFSASQKGSCGGPSHWNLPPPAGHPPDAPGFFKNCSLNDKKWFVLLQLR